MVMIDLDQLDHHHHHHHYQYDHNLNSSLSSSPLMSVLQGKANFSSMRVLVVGGGAMFTFHFLNKR